MDCGEKSDHSLSSIGTSVSSNEENFTPQENSNETENVVFRSEVWESSSTTSEKDSQKREKRRQKIIQEILDTEVTYHRHLNLVIQYLEEPLRKLKLIPDHVIVTIFSNIKQIIKVNEELEQHLQILPVGKAFLQIGPFLKLYSTYANNHERALATLMEWDQKRPEFSTFRRQQESREEFNGLKLNALLITPVQRVPRYKLLLEDLLAHTDQKHEDYKALQEACTQIGAVASHINEHIRQQDNFMKMLAIQKSLVGQLAPKILTPGRLFIKDGPLKKVSKNGGRSHERMFFLFSDILLYAKPKLLDSGSSHTYSCCCIFPLQHCSVSCVFGHSKGQSSLFTVECKDETLLLYSDHKTVESWLKALRSAISKFVENRRSLRKESSAKMPVRKGGLAKYMKQQKQADPLNTARKPQDSPNNKTTPKTPNFLKRSLKERDAKSSPSTPSPRKRQLQEALMKARENVKCLTPRKSGRKKKRREQLSEEDDSMSVSSPVIRQRLNQSEKCEIGLDPSHIWKEGEDSTILEHSSLLFTNDLNQKSQEDMEDSSLRRCSDDMRDGSAHESSAKWTSKSIRRQRKVRPESHRDRYHSSQTTDGYNSQLSLGREKMRSVDVSADVGTSVFSVDSPGICRKWGSGTVASSSLIDDVDGEVYNFCDACNVPVIERKAHKLCRTRPESTTSSETETDYLSPIGKVHCVQNRETTKMQSQPFSSSPICAQNSNIHDPVAVNGHSQSFHTKDGSKSSSNFKSDSKHSEGEGSHNLEEPIPYELLENVAPLKGWTTCYTKFKMLPRLCEEPDSPEDTTSIESDTVSKKDSTESGQSDITPESSKENVLSWTGALEGMNQTAKVMYSTGPYPYSGTGCVIQ